jgi:alcohol dehydrogenase (cytochrome c)
MRDFVSRPAGVGVGLVAAAGLLSTACNSTSTTATTLPRTGCVSHATVAAQAPVAGGWTLPGGDLENTRDVPSAITSANVASLGVAWCVPIAAVPPSAATAGDYAATPVVVNGVVYTQDLESNVMAITLATGKVLWDHRYNSPDSGPNGVTVVNGTVYAATAKAAVALDAATGRQLWSHTLTTSSHEGIDMAPGYNNGTVYVSTAPVSTVNSTYVGGGKGILWALDASTGATDWTWDEVQNLWGDTAQERALNSGGGLWDPPSFDSQGNLYIGIANPGPIAAHGWPSGFPWGTSRPGPDLYTDSVVKLSPQGQLLWYYQLTPHDLYDWDLEDSPMLTVANGQPVVIDGGKAGIIIALNAQTGALIWKTPVGVHDGHDNDGLLTENDTPSDVTAALPATFSVEPGGYGGILSQLATDGTTTFAALNDLPFPISVHGITETTTQFYTAVIRATGEFVAVNQDTGKIEWDDQLGSVPYGAAAVTNGVVFTTTFNGDLYAFDASTGSILLKTPLSAGTNAPVTVDGDYVIAGAGTPLTTGQHPLIIAYAIGANGKLPETAGA